MLALFSSLIHQFDTLSFNPIKDGLIKSAYQEKKRDSVGANHSNRGGWQSKKLSSDNIIVSTIQNEVAKYFIATKTFKENTKITFGNIWVNINRKGDYNASHVHPGSHLSGVMWIKTPKGCGNFIFDNPHAFNVECLMESYSDEYIKKYKNVTDYYFIPQEGNIIIFPSYLQHRVEENKYNTDRISASFNLLIEPPL